VDPYELLGVPPSASIDEAEAAYHRLLRVHHPDLHHGGSDEQKAAAEARTRALNAAIGRIRAGDGHASGATEHGASGHGDAASGATGGWWTTTNAAGDGTDGPATRTHARPRNGWTYDHAAGPGATATGRTGPAPGGRPGWIWDSPASPGAPGREPGGWDTGPAYDRRGFGSWEQEGSPWVRDTGGSGAAGGAWTSARPDFTDRAGGVGGQYFGDPLEAVPCPICGLGFQRSTVLKVHALEEHGIILDAKPKKRRRRRRAGSFFGTRGRTSIWLFVPLNALLAITAATVTGRVQPTIAYWVFAVAMAPTAIRVINRDHDDL